MVYFTIFRDKDSIIDFDTSKTYHSHGGSVSYLPIQKCWKMLPRIWSVVMSPVMVER